MPVSILRKSLFSSFALLLLTAGCIWKPSATTPEPSSTSWAGNTRIELPLILNSQGLPTIPIKVMGQDVMALVDSGTNSGLVNLSIVPVGAARSHGAVEFDGSKYDAVENVSIQLGPLSIEYQRVTIMDFPAMPQFVIGSGLFAQAVIDLDFDAGRMTLIHPDAFTPPSEDPIYTQTLLAVPTLEVKINNHDHAICVIVDTGANTGLALRADVAQELGLPENSETVNYHAQLADGSYESRALAPLDVVGIGRHLYRNVPVGPYPPRKEHNCNLLGMAILSKHRVIFDLGGNRIWLLPRIESQ